MAISIFDYSILFCAFTMVLFRWIHVDRSHVFFLPVKEFWYPAVARSTFTKNDGKIHHVSWENQLFLWKITMFNGKININQLFRLGHVQVRKPLNYQRVPSEPGRHRRDFPSCSAQRADPSNLFRSPMKVMKPPTGHLNPLP